MKIFKEKAKCSHVYNSQKKYDVDLKKLAAEYFKRFCEETGYENKSTS